MVMHMCIFQRTNQPCSTESFAACLCTWQAGRSGDCSNSWSISRLGRPTPHCSPPPGPHTSQCGGCCQPVPDMCPADEIWCPGQQDRCWGRVTPALGGAIRECGRCQGAAGRWSRARGAGFQGKLQRLLIGDNVAINVGLFGF